MEACTIFSTVVDSWICILMLFIWMYGNSCSVWHDTAIPFAEVIEQFEVWLGERQLWRNELGGCLNNAAFVTW